MVVVTKSVMKSLLVQWLVPQPAIDSSTSSRTAELASRGTLVGSTRDILRCAHCHFFVQRATFVNRFPQGHTFHNLLFICINSCKQILYTACLQVFTELRSICKQFTICACNCSQFVNSLQLVYKLRNCMYMCDPGFAAPYFIK